MTSSYNYNSYTSDTPSKRHPWHSESFGDIIDIQQDLRIAAEQRAANQQQQIEEAKVKLRIAKVEQLHRKRVSIPGISEALGLPIEQVEEDLDYIDRSMNQAIQIHTANINNNEQEELVVDEYEKGRRKFLKTGHYEPKNASGYYAVWT
jgi:hypothetical protein